MKQPEDIKTLELPIKRGRGRPPADGSPKTALERQKAYLQRLAASGKRPVTLAISDEVHTALDSYADRNKLTKFEAIEKILRDRLLRKR